jgi:hypothetical protein
MVRLEINTHLILPSDKKDQMITNKRKTGNRYVFAAQKKLLMSGDLASTA